MPPLLILVTGLPGTGKSTVARMLAKPLGATILNSDVLRRELFPEHRTHSSGETQIVIAETDRRTREFLRGGTNVILDALFTKERPRTAYRRLAQEAGATFKLVLVTADEGKVKERMEKRLEAGTDPSDATFAYHLDRKRVFEEPRAPDFVVDTSGDLSAVVATVERIVSSLRS